MDLNRPKTKYIGLNVSTLVVREDRLVPIAADFYLVPKMLYRKFLPL